MLSLAQELPSECRAKAMGIVEKWKRAEIGFEEAVGEILALEERVAT